MLLISSLDILSTVDFQYVDDCFAIFEMTGLESGFDLYLMAQ